MKTPINLGREIEKCCCSSPPPENDGETRIIYPTLYVEFDEESEQIPLDSLPSSGVMTVKFKVVGDTKRVRRTDEGETAVRQLDFEIQSIEGISSSAPAKAVSAEEAFDKLASETMSKEHEEHMAEDDEEE
jgi:hypothetical protein